MATTTEDYVKGLIHAHNLLIHEGILSAAERQRTAKAISKKANKAGLNHQVTSKNSLIELFVVRK